MGMKGANRSGSASDDFIDDSGPPWAPNPVRRRHADDAWAGPPQRAFHREGGDPAPGHPAPSLHGPVLHSGPRWNNPHAIMGTPSTAGSSDERFPLADLRLLIVDDCTLHRENLAAAIAANGSATPKVAWDLSSLVTALNVNPPNLVLINLDTRDSAILVQATFEVCPDVRVIVLGMSEDDEARIVACAEAGVAGYHLRNESIDELIALIGRVASGESLCSPRVSAMLLRRLSALAADRQPAAKELVLTSREAQILRMLEMGLSNKDIAERLCIAVHTVKNHVHSVLTKLGVNTRAEAAAQFRTMRFTGMRPAAYDSEIEGTRM